MQIDKLSERPAPEAPPRLKPAPKTIGAGEGGVLESIGAFLTEHGLPCTKQTLYFSFAIVTGESTYLRALLQRHVGGGGKVDEDWIVQAIADAYAARQQRRSVPQTGVTSAAPVASSEPAAGPAAKRDDELLEQIEGLGTGIASMLARQTEGTEKFAGQLAISEDALSGPDPAAAVEELIWKVKGMLVWQRKAERELAGARRKIAVLKADLEKAQEEATQDSLTRLPNRKAFTTKFKSLCERGESAAVAMIDIDHFKSVNDRYGHPAGDEVLKLVAEHLRQALPEAFVARYGGEEFAVIFETPSIRTAFDQLDLARRKLAERSLGIGGREGEIRIGCPGFSAGITSFLPHDPFAKIMQEVDDLLYRAKKTGRGRVTCK